MQIIECPSVLCHDGSAILRTSLHYSSPTLALLPLEAPGISFSVWVQLLLLFDLESGSAVRHHLQISV